MASYGKGKWHLMGRANGILWEEIWVGKVVVSGVTEI